MSRETMMHANILPGNKATKNIRLDKMDLSP